MAVYYTIRFALNLDTGAIYRRGIDWTEDGSGAPQIVPGSTLETDYADGAGDRISYMRDSYEV